MMKAAQFTGYGEIQDKVKINEIEKPKVSANEVLIQVVAAGVNPLDYKIIEGALKAVRKYSFPSTLGHDVSGKIVEVGSEVKNFKVGDEVFSMVNKYGTFAEFVKVGENKVAKKPNSLTFDEVAAIPLVGLAAIQTIERANVKKGDKILIHAGSGGVGSVAIQYAKYLGAYVYTTTSTTNVGWVKDLGADEVIDYKLQDYRTILNDLDVVIDTLGGEFTEDAFKVIKKGGSVVSLVGPVDKETANRMKLNFIAKWFLAWKRRKITKLIKSKSANYSLVFMRAKLDQLNLLADLMEQGKLKIVKEQSYELKDVIQALQHVKNGRTKGKVVIEINFN